MDGRHALTFHTLLSFEVVEIRVLGKPGESGKSVVRSQKTANVRNALLIGSRGSQSAVQLMLRIVGVMLGHERIEVVALIPQSGLRAGVEWVAHGGWSSV
jgi:hypothetical protein